MRKSNKNIQSANIFETTGRLLSIDETIDSKYDTYWLSHDLHPLMIQENYINSTFGIQDQLKKLQNISYSADALSDMDLFETQVNMINWELEPYVALNVIKAASKCNKKSMIKFPQFLGKISIINKNKREKIDYNEIRFLQQDTKQVNKKIIEKVIEKKPRGRPKKNN